MAGMEKSPSESGLGKPTRDGYPVVESRAWSLPETQDEVTAVRSRRRRTRWRPSGAALAFIFPIVLLYWQAGGAGSLLADPSTDVHVHTGQWILAHYAVPSRHPFSFTGPNKSSCDWEWLSDVPFALAYLVHGLSGVAALSLALLCVTSLVVYRTARLHAGPVVGGGVCALVMASTTVHWLARPHLFAWLGVAAFCWVSESHVFERRAWLLIVPMVLWVNLHPGFVGAFVVQISWLAGACLRILRKIT